MERERWITNKRWGVEENRTSENIEKLTFLEAKMNEMKMDEKD